MGGRRVRLAVYRKNKERKKRQRKCDNSDSMTVQETDEDTTATVYQYLNLSDFLIVGSIYFRACSISS